MADEKSVIERKKQEFEKYRVNPEEKPKVSDVPPEIGKKEEEETEQEPIRCIRCGFDMRQIVPKVVESDRREFIRALLGNRPFTKTYQLYDGQLEIKFHNISTRQAEIMSGILEQIEDKGDILRFSEQALKVKLLFYLECFCGKDFKAPQWTSVPILEEALAEYAKLTDDLTEGMVALLTRAVMEFNRYIPLLLDSGFDKGFWQGAGLE